MKRFIDINKENRSTDYQIINEAVERTEEGLRVISIMYDEHSNDVNSFKNIFWQKNNIYYKLSSLRFNYRILLEELYKSEDYLHKLYNENPFCFQDTFCAEGNPYLLKVERELASIFDNIIFNSVSIFDYLSHAICYICIENKQQTKNWSKLLRKVLDPNNDFSKQQIAPLLKAINAKFVYKLSEYRSRLIHEKRDHHKINSFKIKGCEAKIIVSNEFLTKKYLKIIKDEHPEFDQISLVYAASWIIKRTFTEIENILDSLVFEIKSNSHYWENIFNPKKGKGIMTFFPNPIGLNHISSSERMWRKYKGENLSWLNPKNTK